MNNTKDKIIFWLDAEPTHYCLSYYLQNKINGKLFAIIDITNKPKKFFKQQELVKFEKVWFYHDCIKRNYKVKDLNYLSSFEKKYNIDLWQIVCNDRIFQQYNDYYKFDRDEILAILEQECKLFEDILNSINPDYFITPENTYRHHHLFYEMCKKLGVRVLILNIANIGNLCYISEKRHYLDFAVNLNDIQGNNRDFSQLRNYLQNYTIAKKHKKFLSNLQASKYNRLKAAFEFIINSNSNQMTHYTYFGRTRLRVLFTEIIYSLKRRYRKSFIDRNFVYKIGNDNQPFVFFTLQTEPERSLLIASPFYTNQLETIRHVAKSIPINYNLYVKEHPNQGPLRGWRKISIYKEIMNIPNVTLIHPSVSNEELMEKCSLVVSAGTTSFEAGFYEKPAILCADLGYDILPHIFRINSLEEFPATIKLALQQKVDPTYVDKYLTLIEQNSFEFDYLDFILSYQNWFYYDGNLVDVEIQISKMIEFLNQNKDILEKLAMEHIKKMGWFKEHRLNKEQRINNN